MAIVTKKARELGKEQEEAGVAVEQKTRRKQQILKGSNTAVHENFFNVRLRLGLSRGSCCNTRKRLRSDASYQSYGVEYCSGTSESALDF